MLKCKAIEALTGEQFFFDFREYLSKFFDGIFQAAVGIGPGSIFVSAAIKMLFADFLYIQIALRPQA